MDIIPGEIITQKILFIRWQKVVLDRDLAQLFGVETKKLKQAVRRNIERFPEDFMFELTRDEFSTVRSQFVTSSEWGNRYAPFAFTEHGLLMAANVLRSDQAIQMSINIIRIFTEIREMIKNNEFLHQRLEEIEKHLTENDKQFAQLRFEIKKLIIQEDEDVRRIGFKVWGSCSPSSQAIQISTGK